MPRKKENGATRVEQVVIDGKPGWKYSDGSIRSERGALMVKPDWPALKAAEITSSEQGRAMVKRKYDLMKEQFADGFVEGAPMPERTPSGAWRAVGRKIAELFFAAKSLRGIEGVLPHIARFADFAGSEQDEQPVLDDAREVLHLIADLARGTPRRETVEGVILQEQERVPVLEPGLREQIAQREAEQRAMQTRRLEEGIKRGN